MEERNVTETLTRFAADLAYDSLPREVTEFVKLCIIDQFGVQVGLSALPVSRIAHRYATGFGTGASSIVGSHDRVPPELAAFANAICGHGFELDDMHLPSLNHPGPVVVAPAFAVCEEARANGRTMIEAIACGYEVMGRIGRGLGRDYVYGRGFHPVGVLGPIGSAMAAGKVWRLPANVLAHALGLATSHGGGTIEYNQTWGETTRLHAGLGAMGGIRSAALARAGLPGPGAPIAGKYGFARVHSDQCDFELMVSELGSRYILLYNSFKLRPYHGVLHAVIDMAFEAMARTGRSSNRAAARTIRAVHVGLNSAAMRGLAEGDEAHARRDAGSTPLQFSLRAPVAHAIVHGGTIDSVLHFDPNDNDVRDLAAKISATFDEECENAWYADTGHGGSRICVRVRVEFADGMAADAFGDPFRTQRTPQQLYNKFEELASRVITRSQASELLDALRNLERFDDVSELAPLVRPHPTTASIGVATKSAFSNP